MVDSPDKPGSGGDDDVLDRDDGTSAVDSRERRDDGALEEDSKKSLERLKPLHDAIGNVLAINSFASVLQGFREQRIILLQDLEANNATDLELAEQIQLIKSKIEEEHISALAMLTDEAEGGSQFRRQLQQSLQRLEANFEKIYQEALDNLPEESKNFSETGIRAGAKKRDRKKPPSTFALDRDEYLKKISLAFKAEAEALTRNAVIPGIASISKDINKYYPDRTEIEKKFWKPDVPTGAELEFDRIKSNIDGWPERVTKELSSLANLENPGPSDPDSDSSFGITPTNVMPADRRGMAHRAAWFYSAVYRVATHPATIVGPLLFAFKKPDGPSKGEPDLSHDRAWIDRHIPVHFRARNYVTPVIRKADALLEQSGLIQPILEMNSKIGQNGIVTRNGEMMHAGALQGLNEKLSNNMVKPEQAARQAIEYVKKFVAGNGKKFDEFATNLDSLIVEVSKRQPSAPGMYGLEVKQLKAMKEWLRGIKQIATDVGGDGNFARNYEARINQVLADVKDGKKTSSDLADAILNNFQKITEIGYEAQVRNTDKDVDHFNLWRYVRGIVVRSGPRVYALENTRSRERKIIEGYNNPNIRTAVITAESFNPNTPDNTENFVINIENYHEWKNDPEKTQGEDPEKKLASYVVGSYEVGFEHEALYALRNLLWRAGRAGKPLPVASLLKYIEESKPKNAGDHWDKFITDMRGTITNLPHSGLIFDQRHVLEGYVRWTMDYRQSRKFPGRREISTPGRQAFFIEPREKFLKAFNNYLLPLKSDANSALKKNDKGELLNEDGTKAKFGQRIGLRFKDMGAGVIGFAGRFIRNWGLIWVLPGIHATTATAKFAWNHQVLKYAVRPTVKVGVVATALTIAGTGISAGAREGSFMAATKSIAGNTLGVIDTVGDTALFPARMNARVFKYGTYPIPVIGGGSIWGTKDWGIGPVARWIGWDGMSEGIQPRMISTDWNVGALSDFIAGKNDAAITDTKDPANPDAPATPAQPALTPDKMLSDYMAAVGLDFDADGTPSTEADTKLKDRFMQLMQTRPDALKAIAAETNPQTRNVRIHDLFFDITSANFDGVTNAEGKPADDRDTAISDHWKRQTGVPMPINRSAPAGVAPTTPAEAPASTTPAEKPARLFEFNIQVQDINGDGAKNGKDIELAIILRQATEILADPAINFGKPADANGDGVTNNLDIPILLKILKTQQDVQALTGVFSGDIDGNGRIDEADVARAREVISTYNNMKAEQAKKSSKTADKDGVEPSGPG